MADQVVAGLSVQIGLDTGKFASEGIRLQASAKKISEAFNSISGLKADQKLQEVQAAVQKLGGVANLSAPQVARLRGELEKLSAAGVKIPKTLALPKLETSKLGGAAISQIQAQVQGLASGLGPVGAALTALGPAGLAAGAGIGALVLAAKGFAGLADSISDLSTRTGLSIEATQRWAFAFTTLGGTVEDLTKVTDEFQKSLDKGDPAFAKLGLDVTALKAMDLDSAMKLVLQTIAQTEDVTAGNARAFEIFGKSGIEAAQLARQGLVDLHDTAKVFSAEQIASGDTLKQSIVDLEKEWQRFTGLLGAAAAPALTELLGTFKDILETLEALDKATPDWLRNPAKTFGAKPAEGGKSFLGIGFAEGGLLDRTFNTPKPAAAAAPGPSSGAPALPMLPTLVANATTQKLVEKELQAEAKAAEEAARALEKRNEALRDAEDVLGRMQSDQASAEGSGLLASQTIAASDAARDAADGFESVKVSAEGAAAAATGYANAVHDGELGIGKLKVQTDQAAESTFSWSQTLGDARNAFDLLGGTAGGVLANLTGGLLGAKAAADQVSKAVKGAGGFSKLSKSDKAGVGVAGLGVASNILKGGGGAKGALAGAAQGAAFGAAFGPWGAAIGAVGGGLLGLFGGKSDAEKAAETAGKILGTKVSKEMGEEILRRAKETGKSIEAVAKEIKLEGLTAKFEDLKGKASAAVSQIGTGLAAFGSIKGAAAAQGRIFSAQFFAVVKAEGIKAAQEMFAAAFGKLPDDVKAAIPDEIKNLFAAAENEAFAAAVDAGSAFAEGFRGTVALIGFSDELAKDFGAVAQATKDQAKAGALEAGLSEAEAEKASLQAIVPLLADMKNAAAAAGVELDANTQSLLAQAEAAGIEIPLDPLLQVVDILKEISAVLKEIGGIEVTPKINVPNVPGATGGGPDPKFATGGIGRFDRKGTAALLHGLEAVVPLGGGKQRDGLRVLRQIGAANPSLMRAFLSDAIAAAPPLRIPSFETGGITGDDSGGGADSSGGGADSSGGGGGFGSISAPVSISINVEGGGGDPHAIGEAVANALRQEVPGLMQELTVTIRREASL